MAKIRHLAIYTDDPAKLAQFYVDVFQLEKKQETHTANGGHAVWLSDGYLEVALINPELRASPRGINHFGFTLEADERAGVYERLKAHGVEPEPAPRDRPYIEDAVFDPDGNKFDISTTGLRPERTPVTASQSTSTR
jgi:catechol 2,3-dioxygenase-like lactoylglutathione lyase family enzyme